MAELTWHGHSCFTLVTDDGTRIIFDPWLDENPVADIGSDEVGDLDYILVSHGHADHFADALKLAERTGALLVATFEIASFAESKGITNVHSMSIGGAYDFPFGRVKMTPALHGGMVAGDDSGIFTTVPAGFLVTLPGRGGEGAPRRLYHAGDTALIMDLQLLRGEVDIALLPIGDNYTMGPDDAVRAIDFINPSVVIPMHYNTFDLIRQDPEEFRRAVGNRAEVVILEPGQSYEF